MIDVRDYSHGVWAFRGFKRVELIHEIRTHQAVAGIGQVCENDLNLSQARSWFDWSQQ